MNARVEQLWDELEFAARNAVVAGGMSAMAYYNGALENANLLEDNLSPTTAADIEATLVILRSLRATIPAISAKLDRGYSLFAEKLEQKLKATEEYNAREAKITEIIGSLGEEGAHIKRTARDFQASFNHCLGILFDAIDGTTNFRAGIPVFVSAIAFFIEGEPRVGAIYDPHNQLVYCGSLRNSNSGPPQGHVYVWEVQAGSRADLDVTHLRPLEEKRPKNLISVHLTRSNVEKRRQLIESLESLAEASEGIYMCNSGLFSLAFVASRRLTAFINNYTNIWDVAAGDVLVRASGGIVTDTEGRKIKYTAGSKIGVVAASDPETHGRLVKTLADHATKEQDKNQKPIQNAKPKGQREPQDSLASSEIH